MALYLGIDASTQSVKTLVVNSETSEIVAESSVNFGRDLPQYESPNGFLANPDPLVKQSDPMMWLDALEMALSRLASTGVRMYNIKGISGSGQQHGSVYLKKDFTEALSRLEYGNTLSAQLKNTLTRPVAPIWMDRSSSTECAELTARFGERLQRDTGSPAIERFTGSQIRKFAKCDYSLYMNTGYIHLVSSFMCSVLIGKSAPLDYGDAAGMNLFNLKTLKWDNEIVEFTAPGLLNKLPAVVPSNTIVGTLHPYFEMFGLTPGIPVITWSGDNPNSLVGCGASEHGIAGISLGTSDTLFAPMHKFKTDSSGCGHVFGNPAGGFMSLICFTNGSLARDNVKTQCNVDWEYFDNQAVAESTPGNDGRIILPYFESESTPLVLTPGVKYNYDPGASTPAQNIRAIMESQASSMLLHSKWMGETFNRIRISGGASKGSGFRQILADVFQAAVETVSVSNSASLGAAMRAVNSIEGISFSRLAEQFCQAQETLQPNPDNAVLYDEFLERFAQFEIDSIKK